MTYENLYTQSFGVDQFRLPDRSRFGGLTQPYRQDRKEDMVHQTLQRIRDYVNRLAVGSSGLQTRGLQETNEVLNVFKIESKGTSRDNRN